MEKENTKEELPSGGWIEPLQTSVSNMVVQLMIFGYGFLVMKGTLHFFLILYLNSRLYYYVISTFSCFALIYHVIFNVLYTIINDLMIFFCCKISQVGYGYNHFQTTIGRGKKGRTCLLYIKLNQQLNQHLPISPQLRYTLSNRR